MLKQQTILIIENTTPGRAVLSDFLSQHNFHSITVSQEQLADHQIEQSVDLVLIDLDQSDQDALQQLQYWKKHKPETPCILVSSSDNIDTAVTAMKQGAADYLRKPVNSQKLIQSVITCMRSARDAASAVSASQHRPSQHGFENIVGQSGAMQEIFEDARRVAQTDSTVLITGESGTGKELIAEAIHRNSPRAAEPFVTVNMAAVPEHLVESELFGHTKGSFTGATESRRGRFEAAHHGTLFIDEIGDFKLESQAKLLRVLENHTITPIGSNQDRHVNVRVVAATSHHLEKLVEKGRFREDLYYRLNVINLKLPPLRERNEDIALLVDSFMNQICQQIQRERPELSAELHQYLVNHNWPGNVRQLRNCLESMVVLSKSGQLTMDDLPDMLRNGEGVHDGILIPEGIRLEELERTAIQQTLSRNHGNRTHSAKSLGMSVRTLQRKLKAWGIREQANSFARNGSS
ncbi:sigma-54-dependent transcriptional regulator [Gimesia maris]|uniref:sigma-54-dependent transcriptional regulator n=1 Tax=Gimesia maris TaxID=122 RepID=UPI0011889280|nr:sigma-54 dependent transcriptional regulator [Gimesia maris]QDT80551.1 Nitrogen assimilation regulatory protein [Gimesia maris]|tara:strand:- start:54152 stop:55540 length:1389 start_codon:yes stop_codon:yes gene_type:complete